MRTIAQISDIHFGRIDPIVAERCAEDLHALKPSLLVVSGDLTQRARRKQYQAAADYLKRLPQPQLVVPGNHDIPLYDVIRRFLLPLGRYRHYITKDLRPFYKDEEMAVIGINTARPWTWSLNGFWKDGHISEEQLLDIQLRMGEESMRLHRIVITHHPFIPPPGERVHGMVHGARRALYTMEQCGVDLVLSGHLHMGYSGDMRTHYEAIKRSIISIQAGTATSTRHRKEPNAYNFITLNPDSLEVAVRAYDGSKFAQTVVTRYARVDGIWHPR
jgi:3',5'-cyclic AMP phosphodiesterase CpdA